jgi:hypothetical protein
MWVTMDTADLKSFLAGASLETKQLLEAHRCRESKFYDAIYMRTMTLVAQQEKVCVSISVVVLHFFSASGPGRSHAQHGVAEAR